MRISEIYLVSLSTLFLLLNPSQSVPTNSSAADEVLYDISPFIKIYKSGRVERLIGTDFVPPSPDDPKTGVKSKDISFSNLLNLTARVYLPKNANPNRKLPLIIYYHGGAFFTESAASPNYHKHLNSIVAKANAVALSFNYHLAPEHPLPTAYNESYFALMWALTHRGGRGFEPWLNEYVDFRRVHLAGDSAGANVAHNVAVRAGLGGFRVEGLVLNCPHFWGKKLTRGEVRDVGLRRLMENIWIHAYPGSKGFDDPSLNPATDPSLGRLGCWRVLVFVAGNDVLKGRGYYYKTLVERSGWLGMVRVVEAKGEEHDFALRFPDSPGAVKLVEMFGNFINYHTFE